MLHDDDETEVTGPLCVCCLSPAPWVIWEQRVCVQCGSELIQDEAYEALLRSDQTSGLVPKAIAFVAQWVATQRNSLNNAGREERHG